MTTINTTTETTNSFFTFGNIRRLLGLAIAATATVLCILGFKGSTVCIPVGMVLSFLSYVIGGGFGCALKMAGKVAKFGWRSVFVFPTNLFAGIICFILASYIFIFFPVLFVFKGYLNYRKSLA